MNYSNTRSRSELTDVCRSNLDIKHTFMNKILYTIVSNSFIFGCETKDDLRDTSFATTSIAPL
ncbi:MAG: hypothetical protein CM15mP83_2570 [Flavobacteriaceae bacterium]|nr:MAG: hypothetical protein CM15mP83_2570 [Flavobacteriaceae bacterium]